MLGRVPRPIREASAVGPSVAGTRSGYNALMGCRPTSRSGLGLAFRELLVSMSQRRDEGQLPTREEIAEGGPARAHVVDPVLEAKLLHPRPRVRGADDGESVGLRDRG